MAKLVTPKEAADAAHVHPKTMAKWIRNGWVKARLLPNNRHWRVWVGDDGQPIRR